MGYYKYYGGVLEKKADTQKQQCPILSKRKVEK
jgi:hypothetical protein